MKNRKIGNNLCKKHESANYTVADSFLKGNLNKKILNVLPNQKQNHENNTTDYNPSHRAPPYL